MKLFTRIFTVVLICCLLSCSSIEKNQQQIYNPIFKISLRESSDNKLSETFEVSLNELRKNLKEETFEVKNHPVYENKKIFYMGFFFKDVLNYISKKLKIKNSKDYLFSFWASDNFSSFVSSEDLESGTAFFAWREIQKEGVLESSNLTSDGLWTQVKKHGNPGPFYLVWDNPETTYWKKWPFKIVEITLVSKKIMNVFDRIAPANDSPNTNAYRLVLKNCTSCHKVSGLGFGEMGPDLAQIAKQRNENEFRKQIRTPAGRMIPFNPEALSDDDIKMIYSFLKDLK